jgi:hypothetical protein
MNSSTSIIFIQYFSIESFCRLLVMVHFYHKNALRKIYQSLQTVFIFLINKRFFNKFFYQNCLKQRLYFHAYLALHDCLSTVVKFQELKQIFI